MVTYTGGWSVELLLRYPNKQEFCFSSKWVDSIFKLIIFQSILLRKAKYRKQTKTTEGRGIFLKWVKKGKSFLHTMTGQIWHQFHT